MKFFFVLCSSQGWILGRDTSGRDASQESRPGTGRDGTQNFRDGTGRDPKLPGHNRDGTRIPGTAGRVPSRFFEIFK